MAEPRDTRRLMIASPEDLAQMDARAVLECLSEFLVGMTVSHQDFIDRNADRLGPEKTEYNRGIKDGMEMVSLFVGATLHHGFRN